MKPHINKARCAADPRICPPLANCPEKAFSYIEDENEPVGGRMVIDPEKCTGCGQCVGDCCGSCIELR